MDTKKIFKGLAALAVLIGVIALMKFLPFQEWLKPFFFDDAKRHLKLLTQIPIPLFGQVEDISSKNTGYWV